MARCGYIDAAEYFVLTCALSRCKRRGFSHDRLVGSRGGAHAGHNWRRHIDQITHHQRTVMAQVVSPPSVSLGRLYRRRHTVTGRHDGLFSRTLKAVRLPAMLVLAANRPAATAPTAAPPEASLTISVAPTTVTLADGTTVTLVDPAPRQLLTPQQTGPGVVTWTGLLGALALIATALVAAAATCFMLYVRPVLQAMTATLAEMEAAAKDMQEAADHVESTSQLLQAQLPSTMTAVQGAAGEVQELAGNINKAARLLTPTRLLKRSNNSGSSEDDSSSTSSSKQGATGVTADAISLGASSLLEGIRELGFGLGPSSGTNVTGVIPQLQNLAGMSDFWSSYEEDDTSSSKAGRSSSNSTATSSSSSSSSSVRTVWDALALTLSSAGASKRSLAGLRSDLKAAVNVISVLLGPAGSMLATATADKQDEQQQQHDPADAGATTSTAAQEVAAVAAAAAAESNEGGTSSSVSSMDGRIKIAVGRRLAGSTAVLRSMTEEDIESALAASSSSKNGGSKSNELAGSSTVNTATARDTDTTSSSSNVSSNIGDGGQVASASAVKAAALASPSSPPTAAGEVSTSEASTSEAAAAAANRSRASSPSGRRRRKSKKVEEDEWGLPTVVDTSDDDSSSSSREATVVHDASEATAGVRTVVSDTVTGTAASAASAQRMYPGGASQSYRGAVGWSDSSEDDEEDYAGYKDNSCDNKDYTSTSSYSRAEGTKPLAGRGSSSRGGSSSTMMFAGYDACQDSVLGCDARPDDGITWSQLSQDPHLMRRVFCDNQEEVLQQGISSSRQQQTMGREAHSHQ